MLAQVARAGVRRHLARASATQLLSRSFAQAAEQVVDTASSDKDFETENRRTVDARSLSLDSSSRLRVVDPAPEGFKRTVLTLLGYYGKQSRLIRGANTLYSRISSQVDQPELYANFVLEQNFRTTHAMLVLHMWLSLSRLRSEGRDGGVMGQSLYDAFNHDLERRIIATGLKVLLSKWMKELEKNFYGAVASYDKAMSPEAAQDELARALWRNVFAEDDSIMPTGPNATPVHALARHVRKEAACLALTDSESFLTGNILFSQNIGATD
ncbi:hypothetical protein KC19_4G217000 [Ceratodon purpureus]|uniref:Ubiquinol-cytochrome c chaperone domain-containing protein n=1 Tax=Ceratodon purpureus TaxID=3225 RepID=A0A8T0IDR7_CERPU|nr:hypothetical protein KC19_4G217000 [Ceratodon purpureus]